MMPEICFKSNIWIVREYINEITAEDRSWEYVCYFVILFLFEFFHNKKYVLTKYSDTK